MNALSRETVSVPGDVLALQRAAGNAAVARMIGGSRPVQRTGTSNPRPPLWLDDVLPRPEWWRGYLDPEHHGEARRTHPDNPGELYDHQESPGFQASMMTAYDEYLNSGDITAPVDFAMYQGMHDAVVSQLRKKPDVSGQRRGMTVFPLRASSPTPSVTREGLGGRPLMAEVDPRAPLPADLDALTWAASVPENPQVLISTHYSPEEVPGLVTEALARYYAELDGARTDRERFRAIGRVVRTIHIVHPYDDTNRRLNVHVLLPRLLLAAGYQPVIFKDMDRLFQGGRSLEQIADALERGQGLNLLDDNLVASDEPESSGHAGAAAAPPLADARNQLATYLREALEPYS